MLLTIAHNLTRRRFSHLEIFWPMSKIL